MRTRATIAGAALLAVAIAAPADARTYCRLATEVAGDNGLRGTLGDPTYAPWDLKSLDVAANATHLTGVLRLASVTYNAPNAPVEGGEYVLAFTAGKNRHYSLRATLGGGRDRFILYRETAPWIAPEDEHNGQGVEAGRPSFLAIATGVVDPRANEIRMTVRLSALGKPVLRRGSLLARFGASSASTLVQMDPTQAPNWRHVSEQREDEIGARKTVSYPVGAPSCVRVGR